MDNNCPQDGLALSGNAPRIFTYTLKSGLPIVAVAFSGSFGLLGQLARLVRRRSLNFSH